MRDKPPRRPTQGDMQRIAAKVEKLMNMKHETPVGNVQLDGGGWIMLRFEGQ